MKHILILLIVVFFSSASFSQSKKPFITKDRKLEAGLGIGLFFTEDNFNFYRFQIASRDLILDRFGLYYTFEYIDNGNGDYVDLLGLTYRLNDNFSLQAATGLTNASLFSTESFRKEVAVAFHPVSNPFTFTAGYSITHGPTLTVNYKLFGKKKKKAKKTEIIEVNKPASSVTVNKNVEKPKMPSSNSFTTKTVSKASEPKMKATPKPTTPKVVEKVKPKTETKPKVDYDKLCDDNKLSNKYNSAELSNSEKTKLMNFVNFLKLNTNYKLKITGRADKIGSVEYNLDLGQRRADNAKTFLVSNGVNPNQLISISIGESQSQNANTSQERAAARSTVFKIVTP
jgi:outer membrane protein OmpA-like peptidoglycan-associated protein